MNTGFVLADVCLWIVDQRMTDTLLIGGDSRTGWRTPASRPGEVRLASFQRFQSRIRGLSAFGSICRAVDSTAWMFLAHRTRNESPRLMQSEARRR